MVSCGGYVGACSVSSLSPWNLPPANGGCFFPVRARWCNVSEHRASLYRKQYLAWSAVREGSSPVTVTASRGAYQRMPRMSPIRHVYTLYTMMYMHINRRFLPKSCGLAPLFSRAPFRPARATKRGTTDSTTHSAASIYRKGSQQKK